MYWLIFATNVEIYARIPHRSVLPIQQATRRLVNSKVVSDVGTVTVELKSIVASEKELNSEAEPDI